MKRIALTLIVTSLFVVGCERRVREAQVSPTQLHTDTPAPSAG